MMLSQSKPMTQRTNRPACHQTWGDPSFSIPLIQGRNCALPARHWQLKKVGLARKCRKRQRGKHDWKLLMFVVVGVSVLINGDSRTEV